MISYIQNSHLRNRVAAVDMTSEVIAQCVPVLVDAGFNIIGSASTRGMPYGIVRLIIEGDALPERCGAGEGLLLVSFIFQQDQYGKQRMTRVKEVIMADNAEAIAA